VSVAIVAQVAFYSDLVWQSLSAFSRRAPLFQLKQSAMGRQWPTACCDCGKIGNEVTLTSSGYCRDACAMNRLRAGRAAAGARGGAALRGELKRQAGKLGGKRGGAAVRGEIKQEAGKLGGAAIRGELKRQAGKFGGKRGGAAVRGEIKQEAGKLGGAALRGELKRQAGKLGGSACGPKLQEAGRLGAAVKAVKQRKARCHAGKIERPDLTFADFYKLLAERGTAAGRESWNARPLLKHGFFSNADRMQDAVNTGNPTENKRKPIENIGKLIENV